MAAKCPVSGAAVPAAVNVEAVRSTIRQALINSKANACPMAVRVAWHAAGTYDSRDGSGGSNGATTRFEPESTDDANAGLSIIRDLLYPVQIAHPGVSHADLWTLAGASAVEFLGGPKVKHKLGRTDAADGAKCPANGRIPDASKGADHVREMFYRMGMTDKEIVALCGAHTLGRCHLVRSGYDGKWTANPLKFDNSYFKNLMFLDWKPKQWAGKFQYEATDANGEVLMMLPTDMALRTDPIFREYALLYAHDEAAFFRDFSEAFSKLLALGCPPKCDPLRSEAPSASAGRNKATEEFLEWAMHGSLENVRKFAKDADVHAREASSGRTALHKAAFWGHHHLCSVLLNEYKICPNVQDADGDTALHDACRFGHVKVVEHLLAAGANTKIKNAKGQTALDVAVLFGAPKFGVEKTWFESIVRLLQAAKL
eukprot:m.227697 g.227697  ORF g.227697 m.227697 type:complete len:428 (+) comp17286_c0_seq1:35-1318(+)